MAQAHGTEYLAKNMLKTNILDLPISTHKNHITWV